MERFYSAFLVRDAIERLENQKDLIVAALHANSVYDEHKEAKRDEATQNIEEQFAEMISYIRRAASGEKPDKNDGYDESNPFWAAAKRGVDKQNMPRSDEGDGEVTAAELVESEDSAKEMRDMLAKLDQV